MWSTLNSPARTAMDLVVKHMVSKCPFLRQNASVLTAAPEAVQRFASRCPVMSSAVSLRGTFRVVVVAVCERRKESGDQIRIWMKFKGLSITEAIPLILQCLCNILHTIVPDLTDFVCQQ